MVGDGSGGVFRWPASAVLEAFVLEGVRRLGFDAGDRYSRRAVVAALDELVGLDPSRERFWFLRGFAGEPSGELARVEAAGGEPLFDFYVAGLLVGAVERGDLEGLVATVEAHHDAVMRVMVMQPEPQVTALVLEALVGVAPGEAAALAQLAPRGFPGAEGVAAAFRAEVRAARRRGHREVAALLHHAAHQLDGGSAEGPEGGG